WWLASRWGWKGSCGLVLAAIRNICRRRWGELTSGWGRRGRPAHVDWRRGKQIPLCVPCPPNCGGKEKARDFDRDDPRPRRLPCYRWPPEVAPYETRDTATHP